ncbi:hypothetical protein HMPREF0591_5481 [Mycobacterium parascrofulaceum ATCC BAA-614]|uniref:Uncharacterized protein n=1 Tax=Mycobacterium parascrofulaceum ATCC BAA-614 TaxID=525368 RepID=D5PH37_9MYCO|nr:hypothetical protein HMPREF0591_5481 [Mycobacterium parascrofulaceum ATCC BAA-614]
MDPFAAGAVARSVTSDDSRIASGEDAQIRHYGRVTYFDHQGLDLR